MFLLKNKPQENKRHRPFPGIQEREEQITRLRDGWGLKVSGQK